MSRSAGRSSESQNESAMPEAPARAVRPMRWTYVSGSLGISKLMTCVIPSTSMPRAAMSVATRTRVSPLRKDSSARCRAFCDLLPWMAAASTP